MQIQPGNSEKPESGELIKLVFKKVNFAEAETYSHVPGYLPSER